MIFNALIAVMFLLIPVIWSTKGKGFGLFTAFLAAVCALAAGGIAFAAWEPTAAMLMGLSKDSSSFLGSLLQSNAYMLGLLLPYALSLGLFRVIADSLAPANLDFSDLTNTIGGISFGAVVSFISVGIVAVGLAYAPVGAVIMGYKPIEEKNGSPVYSSNLWIPVDRWVVALYGHLSGGAFASATPLATYRPNAQVIGHMQRMTFQGATRNTWLPTDFELLGTYSVAGTVATILSDTFLVGRDGNAVKQQAVMIDGSNPPEGSSLHGFVIKMNSGSKEKQGNSIMGVGQISLIASDEDGRSTVIQPISCIAPPDAGSTSHYRFRFDANEVFIATKGGASETSFVFEFIVPPGHKPLSLIVKNNRLDVTPESGLKSASFASVQARDAAITDRSMFSKFGAGGGGLSGPVDTTASVNIQKQSGQFEGVEPSKSLPGGYQFNKSNRGPLEVNEKNEIVGGSHTISKDMMNDRAVDKNLRVSEFFVPADVGMIKIELSDAGKRSLLGRSVEMAERLGSPMLIDDKGNTFEAVGFVYAEGDTVQIRYSAGNPIRALSETPSLSRTKTDQSLWLLFLPTKGSKIVAFNVGNKQYSAYPGGIEVR
jgi:hypothetical protein